MILYKSNTKIIYYYVEYQVMTTCFGPFLFN